MKIAGFVDEINSEIKETIKRFPYVLGLLIISVTLASFLIEFNDSGDTLARLLLSSSTGIILTICTKLAMESYNGSKLIYHLLSLTSLVIAVVIFYLLPDDLDSRKHYWILLFFSSLFAGLLLLLSVLPYITNGVGFLTFNKTLFTNFWSSVLISILVFGSIGLFFLALDNLFNVDLGSDIYAHVGLWSFAFVGVTRFVSEVPESPFHKEELKINTFLRFVLTYIAIPISVVYGIVAYGYLLKSVMGQEDTIKWINPFMMWYFVIGFNAYFLNKVISKKKSIHSLMDKYWLWFSLPLIIYFVINLFFQIRRSTLDEEFYYLLMVGFLLLISTLYLVLKKNNDLRIINFVGIGLCIFSISPSPFNAWNGPTRHQQKKLIGHFSEIGILRDGQLVVPDSTINLDNDIRNVVEMLDSKNELEFLKQYDRQSILSDTIHLKGLYGALLMKPNYQPNDIIDYFGFSFPPQAIDIATYDTYVPILNYDHKTVDDKLILVEGSPVLCFQGERYNIDIPFHNLEKGSFETIIVDSIRIKIFIQGAYGDHTKSGYLINDLSGVCLVGVGD